MGTGAGACEFFTNSILRFAVLLTLPMGGVITRWFNFLAQTVRGGRRSIRFPMGRVITRWREVLALSIAVTCWANGFVLCSDVTDGQRGTNTVGRGGMVSLYVLVVVAGRQLTTQSVTVRVCLFDDVLVVLAGGSTLTRCSV